MEEDVGISTFASVKAAAELKKSFPTPPKLPVDNTIVMIVAFNKYIRSKIMQKSLS